MRVAYREEPCRTALNRVSGMGFRWSLNPYMGCAHRCAFCYVRGFERRADRPSDDRYRRLYPAGGVGYLRRADAEPIERTLAAVRRGSRIADPAADLARARCRAELARPADVSASVGGPYDDQLVGR